jgi:hypothetical protein
MTVNKQKGVTVHTRASEKGLSKYVVCMADGMQTLTLLTVINDSSNSVNNDIMPDLSSS